MGMEDTSASSKNIVTELDLRTNELRTAATTLFDRAFEKPGEYGGYHIFHYRGQAVVQQKFDDGSIKRIVVSRTGEQDNPVLSIEQVQFVPDKQYHDAYHRYSTRLWLAGFVPITTTHEDGYFSDDGSFRVTNIYSEETDMLNPDIMDDMQTKLLEVNGTIEAAIAERSRRRWWHFGSRKR